MRETMKVIFIVGPFDQTAFEAAVVIKEILAKNYVGVCSFYDLLAGGIKCKRKYPWIFFRKNEKIFVALPASGEYKRHLCGIFLRTTASAILALPEWEKSEIAKDAVAYAKHYPSMEVFYPKLPTIDDRELRKAIGWGRAPWLMTIKK